MPCYEMWNPFFFFKPLVFMGCFLVANSLNANGLATFFVADSLPKMYKGYRLSLANFTIEKESKKATTIRCIVANTGRLPVIFSEKSPAPIELVVELDSADLPPKLVGQMAEIEAVLLRQKINLAPGKFRQDLELEILIPELVAARKKSEKLAAKKAKPVQKEAEPMAEKPAQEVESNPELVENQPVSPLKTEKSATKPAEKKQEKQPATTSQKEEKQPLVSSSKPAEKTAEPETFSASKKCGDLVFDTIFLLKKSKKTATLAFRIRNIGSGTANIGGDSPKKQTDNLAVNVYFSGAKKLTRGAILADGIFIGTDPKGNSLLLPGEKFEAEIQIPLENQTRFMPMVIFELDPFQTVGECDKTNNTRALLMPEN